MHVMWQLLTITGNRIQNTIICPILISTDQSNSLTQPNNRCEKTVKQTHHVEPGLIAVLGSAVEELGITIDGDANPQTPYTHRLML